MQRERERETIAKIIRSFIIYKHPVPRLPIESVSQTRQATLTKRSAACVRAATSDASWPR